MSSAVQLSERPPAQRDRTCVAQLGAYAAVLIALVLLWAGREPLQPDVRDLPADFYRVGDRQIELRPSGRYLAVRLPLPIRARVLATIERSGVVEVETSPLLDRHGVTLLRRSDGQRPGALFGLRDALAGHAEALPTYASAGIDLVLVNEFTLELEANAPASVIGTLRERYSAAQFEPTGSVPRRYRVSFPDASSYAQLEAINAIATRPHVRFAAPDFLLVLPREDPVRAVALAQSGPSSAIAAGSCGGTPDDPLLDAQWSLANPDGTRADIRAREAWTVTTGSPDVRIAILDDGLDSAHPDLAAKIAGQYDAVSDDADATPVHARDAHGTASAGIAAASTNNCEGIAGVAWGPLLYGVRVLDGTSGSRVTQPSIVERGMRNAIAAGARVLSLGLAGGEAQPAIESAIDAAIAAGAVLILPAGNGDGAVAYPARLASEKTVIAVAATNRADAIKRPNAPPDAELWGSNTGPEITTAAPGVGILSTDLVGERGFDGSGDYYPYFNGTSAAAPMVAGAAALLLSVKPDAKPDEIRTWIACGGDRVGSPGQAVRRLNVARSLAAAFAGCE